MGLQTLWLFPLKKPDFSDLGVLSGHVLPKTMPLTHVFKFLTSLIHHLSMVKFQKKINVRKFSRERPLASVVDAKLITN